MKFLIEGQPRGKQRVRVMKRGNFAHSYTPEQTVSYENYIKECYLKAREEDKTTRGLWDMPLIMNITAIYTIPKSYSKKKTTEALEGKIRPQTKPDLDNICKVVCDALNTIAYADDKQIVRLTTEKHYGERPMVIVELKNWYID